MSRLEKGLVPLQGEALPDHVAVAGVKGKDDQDDDGGIEKQEHQRHQQPVAKSDSGSVSTASPPPISSPSPKRFITSIHHHNGHHHNTIALLLPELGIIGPPDLLLIRSPSIIWVPPPSRRVARSGHGGHDTMVMPEHTSARQGQGRSPGGSHIGHAGPQITGGLQQGVIPA